MLHHDIGHPMAFLDTAACCGVKCEVIYPHVSASAIVTRHVHIVTYPLAIIRTSTFLCKYEPLQKITKFRLTSLASTMHALQKSNGK